MKPTIRLFALVLGLLLVAACNPVRPSASTLESETSAAEPAAAGQSLAGLSYAGPQEVGGDDTSRCAVLQIDNNEAQIGACDGTAISLPLPDNLLLTWTEMADRFAAFEYQSPTEQLTFEGMGDIAGEEWQRAILAWARMTRAELDTGKTSASARTALSWNLGLLADTPGVCAHLTVLDFGYAYAEQRNCESGDLVSAAGGWLEQAEMEQFDNWLYAYSPIVFEDNYLNGLGDADLPESETPAIAAWAQALWTRIAGLPLAPIDVAAGGEAGPDGGCTAADTGGSVYSNPEYGFCLVAPTGYGVIETEPGNFSLVAGGDVLNHIAPRMSIEITEAGERTLELVSEELIADYAPAGETPEQQAVTVDGVEGVLLDNLMGQDLNRRLVFVHNGRVYSLMLAPLSPEAEPFYQGVLDSLRFLPEP